MIQIELDDTDLRQALARLQEAVGDLSPVMRQIGELLVDRTRQRFREGKAPDGSAWAPNTLEAFMRRYYGGAVPRRKRDGAPTASATRTDRAPLRAVSRSPAPPARPRPAGQRGLVSCMQVGKLGTAPGTLEDRRPGSLALTPP
jgi:hypothetical protein